MIGDGGEAELCDQANAPPISVKRGKGPFVEEAACAKRRAQIVEPANTLVAFGKEWLQHSIWIAPLQLLQGICLVAPDQGCADDLHFARFSRHTRTP